MWIPHSPPHLLVPIQRPPRSSGLLLICVQGEQPSDLQLSATTGEASAAGSFLLGLDSAKNQGLAAMLARLEPKRAAALQRALLRVELIKSEGVILMPPIDLVIY